MSPEIVVDIGCHNHGVDTTAVLIDRFKPGLYYGFDPLSDPATYETGGTLVQIRQQAAWLYDGEISFNTDGDASQIVDYKTAPTVPCFDFCTWFDQLPAENVILKLDCEGSEFALLDEMRHRNQLDKLKLLLVEWHIPCEVEAWAF